MFFFFFFRSGIPVVYPQCIADDVEGSMLIGRVLSAASASVVCCFEIFVDFDFSPTILISWIIMEIQRHKRMRQTNSAENGVRVLSEGAFEHAMCSLPTIRQ